MPPYSDFSAVNLCDSAEYVFNTEVRASRRHAAAAFLPCPSRHTHCQSLTRLSRQGFHERLSSFGVFVSLIGKHTGYAQPCLDLRSVEVAWPDSRASQLTTLLARYAEHTSIWHRHIYIGIRPRRLLVQHRQDQHGSVGTCAWRLGEYSS